MCKALCSLRLSILYASYLLVLTTCVDRCQQFERANRAFARELVRRRSAPEIALDKLVLYAPNGSLAKYVIVSINVCQTHRAASSRRRADMEQTLASRVIQVLHAASDGHRGAADQLPSWPDVIAQSHQRWAESIGSRIAANRKRTRTRYAPANKKISLVTRPF